MLIPCQLLSFDLNAAQHLIIPGSARISFCTILKHAMPRLLSHHATLRPVAHLSSPARRATSHSHQQTHEPYCMLHSLLLTFCRPSLLEGQFLSQVFSPWAPSPETLSVGDKKSKTSLSIVSVSSLPYRSLLIHSISFMKYFSTCMCVVCLSHELEGFQLFHSPICTSY